MHARRQRFGRRTIRARDAEDAPIHRHAQRFSQRAIVQKPPLVPLHMGPPHHDDDAKEAEHVQDQQQIRERADIGEEDEAEERNQRPDIDMKPVAPELDLPALRERVSNRVHAAPARRPRKSDLPRGAAIDR